MRKEHLKYLVCPKCKSKLSLTEIVKQTGQSVETGILQCTKCGDKYDITRYIPRFVPLENYASSFGLEWIKHAKTQYDSYSGVNVSETRFFEETKWSHNLENQVILEVGSGSGRFTEHAASTGAMVVTMDFSYAVEANYASNGSKSNVLVVQADIYMMPFAEKYFDKVLCIGVLQHTPDVEKAFMVLPNYLKSGGNLVIDVYRKLDIDLKSYILNTRRWGRLIVKYFSSERLYSLCEWYINTMWPVVKWLDRIGKGKYISLMIIPYYKQFGLSESVLKEWALLDIFDILSATYEHPQTLETVQGWFRKANLSEIDVHYGYNGIEGRGIKP